jgi:hypothetical protein
MRGAFVFLRRFSAIEPFGCAVLRGEGACRLHQTLAIVEEFCRVVFIPGLVEQLFSKRGVACLEKLTTK